MRTIVICTDITLTASEKTIRAYEAELAEIRAEQEAQTAEQAWHEAAFICLQNAYESGDWDLYSDLYKDLFGVRPRQRSF